MLLRSAATLGVLLASLGCSEAELRVLISSPLSIPGETDTLLVRIEDDRDEDLARGYTLGPPPRDVWPQVLPILTSSGPRSVKVSVELQLSRGALPALTVGFGEARSEIPGSGTVQIELAIPRSGPPDPPQNETQDGGPAEDGGQPPDSGARDAEAPDAGARDAGARDAGARDAGVVLADGGLPPHDPADTGFPLDPNFDRSCAKAGSPCSAPQFCVDGQCSPTRPLTDPETGNGSYACSEALNLCICAVPCTRRPCDEPGLVCTDDGCCHP